jgi:hypothetical protein
MKYLKVTLLFTALIVSSSGMAMDKTAAGAVAERLSARLQAKM